MRLRAIMMTLICALAISCSQKEEFVLSPDSTFLTVTVESSDASTKVGFTSGNADFFWTKGDVIGVTTSATSTFLAMNLQGEGGNSSGVFTGTISGQPSGYAIYPYGELGRHSLNGTELTYKLPAEYTYTSTDASYAKVDGNSHNAPMWGAISNGSVAFKHLGGVFAVQVNDLPANTQGLKLVLTASKQISGTFTADLSAETPVLVSADAVSEADKKVTINFATAEEQTTGHFYIPLPTGAVGDLLLTITDSESNLLAIGAWDNRTITRRMIAKANVGQQSVEGAEGQVKSVGSVGEIDNTILSTTEEDLVVNVTSQLQGNENVIEIPASLATQTTTFSFASIANNAEIEINAVENAYAGQIIIEIPADATLPVVNANIPNGEVYIKQGTVTTLVVASADNTTIIGAGATVETLEVLKGNVRILKGGVVTTIKRSTDNTDAVTNVIFEGELPSSANADSKIIYVSAAEWDLKKAAKNGGTYTMTADVILSEGLVVENDFTLNMGGKTITAPNGAFEVANGTLTIKNGVINSNYVGKDAIAIVGASESSKIIVNVESDAIVKGGDCCVAVYGSNKSKDITINTSGTLVVERKGYAAIQANGSSVGVKMNVTGGSITAVDAAIYFPCTTSLNISGGTITGATAVYQKSGELNISGGKLVGNGAKVAYSFNGSGCNETGDALVVESCNYPSGAPSINITGGEFVSVNASAIGSYVGNGATEKVTGFVKGGIFHDSSVFEHLAADANITLASDVTLSEPCTISANATINMGGKTITAPNGAFEVANGTLIIKNGVINSNYVGKDAIAIVGSSESSKIIVNVESDATVKGGDCCVVVYGSNKSKDITINTSGTLVVERKGYAAIQANGSSVGVKMNVTGGSITAVDAAIYFPCTTSLNISGGTITGATAVYQKSGELNISGGKLVGNGAKVAYSFNGDGCNETGDALVVESCNYPSGVPSINITGGEFVSVNASAIGSYVGNGATEKVTGFVKGGTFTAADDFDLSLLSDGYGAYELTENKWTAVSKTSTVEVSSETALRSVAVQGGIAKLVADISLNNLIEVRTDLKVYLNNRTLILPASSTDPYKDVFEVFGSGCLTIEGDGEVIAEDGYCVYAAGDSRVFINGGYYFSDVTIVDARKNAVVTINGGEFKVDGSNNPDGDKGQKYTLNLRDKKGSYISDLSDIIVKGGKFWKYNPAASESEPEITNFVAEGYKSVQEGDYYVVSKNN